MHLYIEHTRFDGLQNAKQLAKNLIETLQQELVHFQQVNPPVPAQVQYSQQSVPAIQPHAQVNYFLKNTKKTSISSKLILTMNIILFK